MKKKYIKPIVEVIEVETEYAIMSSSGSSISVKSDDFFLDDILDDGDAGSAASRNHYSIWDD